MKTSGEVAAIIGYEFQYSIFAAEIYNCLLNETNQIEWIEFASSQAGKVDDVLIGLEKSVLAFQVKNINSSTVTYNSLLTSPAQSILEGMLIGWRKISIENPSKIIDIRFITTQSVSKNDRIDEYGNTGKPSFQQLISDLWIPIKNGKYGVENIPEKWSPVFQQMVRVTKSSAAEFIEFIKSTSFIFNYSIPKLFDSYIERQRRIDIEDITRRIFQVIARNGNIRYSKREFLERFGLLNRYESYYKHSFFVDESHYQSIDETINQLESVIKNQTSGYIALIGNAGSGKSTLLTKWLQNSDYLIFKYYAYVNTDMSYEYGFRGGAKTFLHDILVQIRQGNYAIQDRIPTDNLEDLQKHLNSELNKLSNNENPIIIIVDGLDHIEREQAVSKSLIDILPLPETIPQNIYFLLGSRTIQNLDSLHPRIKSHLAENSRIVSIRALSKLQTQTLLNSYQIYFDEALFEKLYSNTKGHPLFLRYTIEEIKNNQPEQLENIVAQRVFSGDIYNEYRVFWEKIKENDDFVEILGILSRLRHSFFNVDILTAVPKISRENLYAVNKLAENYFYRIGSIWQFFHNSFKEFLISETSKNILTGGFDGEIDKSFHLKIADVTLNLQTEYRWNRVYHLYKAEDFLTICKTVTQNYFRQQWFEYRNYKIIKEDIQIATNASIRQNDIYCLFRCYLSIFELKQRNENFHLSDYFDTFHQLGKIPLANSFVYDNIELLVPQKAALDYCISLYKHGQKELAYDIYLRAVPSYILSQSKTVNPRRYDRETYQEINEVELIKVWSKVASLFVPIETVLSQVKEINIEGDHQLQNRDLYSECIDEIIDISIQTKNWANLKILEQLLLSDERNYDLFYFYFDIVSQLGNHEVFYNHCIASLQSINENESNPVNRRLLIVNLIITKNIEKAKVIFPKLLLPTKVKRQDYSTNETDYLNYIFDYSRFYYIITKDFTTSPTAFLPSTDKHTKAAFYYAFAELGKSFAYIYHNYDDAVIGYYSNFETFLKLFHYRHADYGYDYSVSESKPVLITLILKITSKISVPAFNEMLQTLSVEWNSHRIYWSISHIQEIIEWVSKSGLNPTWCISHLNTLEPFPYSSESERTS